MDITIIPTKIRVPPPPRQLLHRTRLIEALSLCQDYRLTLISAGAGYGKTTLLTDFARHTSLSLCWYALDESDRDPAVFCAYLLHSVRRRYPNFGTPFEQLLDYNLKELHHLPVVQRLADQFICDLQDLVLPDKGEVRDTLIVLDDFQFAESVGVNNFVKRLLEWLPDNFHLLLASRSLPQDLAITRLLAKQKMLGLGQPELAFQAVEVDQLLGDFYGIHDSELARTLATYSEGWITAVILALSNRNLLHSGDWRKLEAVNGNFDVEKVFNYLAQEVLASQTAEAQTFLLKTSVLDQLNSANCTALLEPLVTTNGTSPTFSSENLLKQLESRNLFITSFSQEGQTYFQYHVLFRNFLLSKLKQNNSLYKQIQRRAASIQKDSGHYVEAIQHYVAADELLAAANLLDQISEPLYETGRTRLLADLVAHIPLLEQERLPHLLNIKARLLLDKGDNQAAIRAYIRTEQLYREEGLFDHAARAVANQAQMLFLVSQRSEALALCQRVLQDEATLRQSWDGKQAVATAHYMVGAVAIDEGGNRAAAEEALRAAATIYTECADDFHLAVVENSFGLLYYNSGRLIKSNVHYNRALAYFVKTGNVGRETYVRTALAINAYTQGQYQKAEEQLDEALVLAYKQENQYLQLYLLAYLGNLYRDTERYSKAEIVYNAALRLAQQNQVRKMELQTINDLATALILQDKGTEASDLIKASLELNVEYKLPEKAGFSYRNQSWLEYSKGSYKRALEAIERAVEVFLATQARAEEARAKLTQSVILLAMGEPRKAATILTESLILADELGFEPFLPFEMKWAEPLFNYAAGRKLGETVTDFLRRHGFLPGLPEIGSESVSTLQVSQEVASTPLFSKNTLYVFGLDGGTIWLGEKELKAWRSAKAREILFFLLEYKTGSRDQLLTALWPDDDSQNPANLLHAHILNLRRAIAPIEVKRDERGYYLQGQIWYDAAEFSQEVKLGLATPANQQLAVVSFSQALRLYKRDFLEYSYGNWITERQQSLLQLYLRGLKKLGQYHQQNQQYLAALLVWQQFLLKDAYDEAIYRAAMQCCLALNNRAEAQHLYKQCQKALDELNLKPTPETSELLK